MRVTCDDEHEAIEYGSDRTPGPVAPCPLCDAIGELANAEDIANDLESEIMDLRQELEDVRE